MSSRRGPPAGGNVLRPYRCHLCGKTFGHSGNLKTHMLVHTGQRMFRCEICDYRFKLKHHLTKHMALLHGATEGAGRVEETVHSDTTMD